MGLVLILLKMFHPKIPVSLVRGADSRDIETHEAYQYRDLNIRFQWCKRGRGKFLGVSLKVDVPDHYSSIELGFKIYLIKENQHQHLLRDVSYGYDDGRNYGPGGFGLDGRHIKTEELFNEYIWSDEKIHFIVKITKFIPDYDQTKMLLLLLNEVKNNNDYPLESLAVQKHIKSLLRSNQNMERDAIQLMVEISEEKARLDSLQDATVKTKSDNKKIDEENSRFEEQLKELKETLSQMEKDVQACSLNDALLNFDPDSVSIHTFDIETLKSLMSNILQLQIRLSNELLNHPEDRCGLCGRITQVLSIPCSHVMTCKSCLRQKPDCPICSDRIGLDNITQTSFSSEDQMIKVDVVEAG